MVTLITSTQELISRRSSETKSVALVATMGNLHSGHISLLEEAFRHGDVIYFSIFVNPKQFGPAEDFNRYPRTLDYDLNLIQESTKKFPGKDVVVFAPTDPKEVFPLEYNQTISVPGISKILEGKIRPDHFDGVTTVVHRLFELIKPKEAFFGLKDYQQYLLIKQMVKDLAMPIEVIGMPIIREASGLALSSRNQYLSEEQRSEALILSQSLQKISKLLDHKKTNLPQAKREIDLLVLDKKWNYLEMRDAETLSEDLTHSKKITLLGVYQLGTTRLLDNSQMEIE